MVLKIRSLVSEKNMANVFCILCILLFAVLFFSSLTATWEHGELIDEHVYYRKDSWAAGLCLMAVLLGSAALLKAGSEKICAKWNMDAAAAAVCVLAAGISIYWVGASNTYPRFDQLTVCELAEEFNMGDISRLQRGGYGAVYYHQLGLVTLLRVLYRLFGEGNYRAFQYFNAVLIPLLIFSGYRIAKKITDANKTAELFYLILMLFCVPLYGYVPFVYGEISSLAFLMLAGWMLLSCLESFSWGKGMVMACAMGLAVQLKKNSLIVLIAFCIVAAVKLSGQWNRRYAATVLLLVLGAALGQTAVDGIYQKYIPEDAKPMPMVMHIAMGVNDDNGFAGWFNMYNWSAYEEAGFDPALAKEDAYGEIRAFLDKCRENPGYMADFYYRKFNMQWNAPMYQVLVMNLWTKGPQSRLAEKIYGEDERFFLESYMNTYQLAVYGSILFLLVRRRKSWRHLEKYVLLIAVFGGFLFSLMWEAKTRYIFPYFIMMLPYAALGLWEAASFGKPASESRKPMRDRNAA